MTDPFLEVHVRDLIATAKQQAAARQYDAARDTYRTALAAVEGTLLLDPSNQTAVALRAELAAEIAKVAKSADVTDSVDERRRGPVKAPGFELLPGGDTPLLENAAELLGSGHGGYLPEPETLSILDETRKPEQTDYLPYLAAVAVVLLLAIAVRVITYYSTSHAAVDSASLEARAHIVPLTPLPPVDATTADDTIYYPQQGVTLPVLQSKFEPPSDREGRVILLVLIDPAGKPVDPKVVQGLSADENIRALQGVGKWRFRPGTKDGRPVPVMAQVVINFQPVSTAK